MYRAAIELPMCSCTCSGVQSCSGSVTLKNASFAVFSYGPGVSMEAR